MSEKTKPSIKARSARRKRRGFGIAVVLLVIGTAAIARERIEGPAGRQRAMPILVLPFENKTRETEYHWIGEACALLLSELLARMGEPVISPDDRRALYEQLRLPEGLVVTRASALLVAERLGAERLLVGTYHVSGPKGQERVTLTVRVIHVSEARMLSNELTAGAPLGDLVSLIVTLAGEVAGVSPSASARAAISLPISAVEYYVKARMATDPQVAIPLLRRAEHAARQRAVEYAPLLLELGRAHAQQGQCAEALPYLRRLGPESSGYLEAQFYVGICAVHQGEWERAWEIYRALVRAWPLAEVFNNLAVVELRLGHVAQAASDFSQALERADADSDLRFNYGYALWKLGDFEKAAEQFRHVVRRRVTDGEAHYLLGKSIQRLGREEEARSVLTIARRYLPAFAEWEKLADPPIVPRLKRRIAFRIEGRKEGATRARVASPLEAVREAEALVAAGREQEALALLEDVVKMAPDMAEAHLLRARLYLQRGKWQEAADAAHAAAFWNPRWAPAHLMLARIYLAVGERERARMSVERALALDPNNAEARELARSLEGPPRKP
jgi:tetratricopeptide (TPR) repeat protein